MKINKTLLKKFYDVIEVKCIERPKYYGFYEILDGRAYPWFTPERFVKLLNVLWREQIDMNFDGEYMDLESLIHLRGMIYPEVLLTSWVDKWAISMEPDVFNTICYEARKIFKEE